MRKTHNHTVDSLFTFLLLLIFALFALILALMGSSVYKSSISHLNENYTSRTAIAFINEKVRQHDSTDSIYLTEVEEIPALAFREQIQGEDFLTYVYYYDGALRELLARKSSCPQALLGTEIVKLDSFEIEDASASADSASPSLLRVTAVSTEGTSRCLFIPIQSN